ncbi:MAG: hypothetical protein NZ700_15600 [Gemmataceae bacterium]|nr:hypothetical protein [Gemmataceae bacterium]MDW8263719.1 hypothetical protein [Gemmataceae bacterium]
MVRHGTIFALSAGTLISLGLSAWLRAGPADDRDAVITATLAVQTALQQGRDHLFRNDPKSAVYVLESQLAHINGNPAYLALLRDAYRALIKELKLANQDQAVALYMQRLQILDPGAILDGGALRPAHSPAPTPPLVPSSPPSSPAVAPPPASTPTAPPPEGATTSATTFPTSANTTPAAPRPDRIARGKLDDAEPVATLSDRRGAARGLLARAEEEFSNRRFREASLFYEQAHHHDPECTVPSRERWAYCKLYRVVEQINQSPAGSLNWDELEREVRQAIELAPRLEYGRYLLGELQRRREPPREAAPPVQHADRGANGWAKAETANFRIFHNQPRDYAEQVARVAEQTRVAMFQKWFGQAGPDWTPKCDIYLHATAQDYGKATGAPTASPGHSSIRSEAGRVVRRRIDLHVDDPNLLSAVLPHETTHVVLAGQFGEHPVPRWADEGMAVLTEPREKVERHLRNLHRCRQENQLFSLQQLMQLPDYPEPRAISAFYAQSVSLVDFLCQERSPQVFAQFLRDGLHTGYEAALRKHYGYRGFDELQQRWSQKAFGSTVASQGP